MKDKKDREYLFRKEREDRERFDSILKAFEQTLFEVFSSVSSTNNTFHEMVGEISKEHFEQLRLHSEKQHDSYNESIDKILDIMKEEKSETKERISILDKQEQNSIEKEEEIENPLEELSPAQFANIKNVQFDGEEEIFPIGNE